MILAIEGAPGVGKSTTAEALERAGAFVVPEVNLLFAKPDPEPVDWYLDRQNARWEMAALQAGRGRLAVLDGDPFQPIWFSWAFDQEAWAPPPRSIEFYRQRFREGRMDVPELYVFVHIPEEIRRERMLARERARGLGEERAQRKTNRYARLAPPQRAFFQALADRFPGWVLFVETTDVARSVAAIRDAEAPANRPDGLDVLDFIANWVTTERAGRWSTGRAQT